ncbi:nitrate respiration regulation response regulator NreC [Olivibacter ginsenosidimutans]|uniref:Nitrate respiration regulation response regulator NreC n=1 Tax=Olivibacter ginsenosidimutans TaxID=1176537 RepID=A0ABP9ABC8_9SPHI
MQPPIKLAVIDDQHLLRDLLVSTLCLDPSLEVVQEAANAHDFLISLSNASSLPHIALLDMSMPGMNGMELTKELQQSYPEIRIMILTVNYSPLLVAKLIGLGVSAYLHKNCPIATLKQAIHSVFQHGFYMDHATLEALRHHRGQSAGDTSIHTLSKREIQVLQLICQEFTAAEIAEKLFISIRTVEGHRNNLLLKTGCRNSAGLVVYAIKHQLFDLLTD